MFVVLSQNETLASGLSRDAAIREARIAAQLFGEATVFNIQTREFVRWTN